MTSSDLALAVGLVVVAWLTAGGMAIRSVGRIWLRHWAERRLRGAPAALTYLERPQRLLVAANAGVALTLVLAGLVLGARHGGPPFILGLAAYAGLAVVVGQMIPRAVARRWAPHLVPAVLPVLRVAEIVAAPLVELGRAVAAPFERPDPRRSDGTDRDAIQDLLREGELEGVGEHDEIAIISGVVEFGQKRVGDVMTPRAEIFAIEETADARALATRIAQSAYSRVPVYRGSLDTILGMVLAFDVLKSRAETVPELRPVAYAATDTPCNDLLFRMLFGRVHLAIVRDPTGRTLGLVTLEDLLEELVGDIRDEHDEPELPRVDRAK